MEIPNKREVIVVGLGLVVMFALGRYSVDTGVDVSRRSDAQSQFVENKNTHEQIKTIVSKAPDGAVTTTTVKDIVVNDAKQSQSELVSQVDETPVKRSSALGVSVLGGYDLNLHHEVYGLAVRKQIFGGPIGVGVWGLNSSVGGVLIEINF